MQKESNKKTTGVSPVSVGVVNNNIAPDFNRIKDIDVDMRLKYIWSFAEWMQYVLDNTRGSIDYSFLN